MVPRINVVNYGPDSSNKKGGRSHPLALHRSTNLRRASDPKELLQDRWSLLVLVECAQLHRE
jgi:hypothetical protein